jgi:hypothetical protein
VQMKCTEDTDTGFAVTIGNIIFLHQEMKAVKSSQ